MRRGTQKQRVLLLLMTGPCRTPVLWNTGVAYRRCVKELRSEGYDIRFSKQGDYYELIGGKEDERHADLTTSFQTA